MKLSHWKQVDNSLQPQIMNISKGLIRITGTYGRYMYIRHLLYIMNVFINVRSTTFHV